MVDSYVIWPLNEFVARLWLQTISTIIKIKHGCPQTTVSILVILLLVIKWMVNMSILWASICSRVALVILIEIIDAIFCWWFKLAGFFVIDFRTIALLSPTEFVLNLQLDYTLLYRWSSFILSFHIYYLVLVLIFVGCSCCCFWNLRCNLSAWLRLSSSNIVNIIFTLLCLFSKNAFI